MLRPPPTTPRAPPPPRPPPMPRVPRLPSEGNAVTRLLMAVAWYPACRLTPIASYMTRGQGRDSRRLHRVSFSLSLITAPQVTEQNKTKRNDNTRAAR